MKLPNGDKAIVEPAKLCEYCLNTGHPRGRYKARVFASRLDIRVDNTDHRLERHYGEFRRVVPLATPVDAEKVDAHYKGGVLSIHVPKSEAAKPRRINVQA